jgi:hypothetical protein
LFRFVKSKGEKGLENLGSTTKACIESGNRMKRNNIRYPGLLDRLLLLLLLLQSMKTIVVGQIMATVD